MKVKLHSQTHEWHERDEERRRLHFRACWDARNWHFFHTTNEMEEWEPLPEPKLEHYEALRDVLWRKYQRKRLPWRFVEEMDTRLAEMRLQLGLPPKGAEEEEDR
ncbi:hypothetical protein [Verrucomicrobium spinosum]|uniref:hypothetical protein n=1 Tax=Verrucomicrobium spinosum TaxID=2736 RepID=UPI000174501D|nr:hypothetical protein [Verrucomicrobium spinosum]